jgi:hypothetical protein
MAGSIVADAKGDKPWLAFVLLLLVLVLEIIGYWVGLASIKRREKVGH